MTVIDETIKNLSILWRRGRVDKSASILKKFAFFGLLHPGPVES